jgi:general secretion pathway protein D
LRGRQFELALENAEIAAAARSVLGEVLNVSYTLDPRVTGQITLVTGGPSSAEDILSQFESALRSGGAVMVRQGDRLVIMPAADAVGVAQIDAAPTITPGYGVTVIPLRHVPSETMMPLMDNFVTRTGMVREDRGRNALIVQGTAEERLAAVNAVRSFDQDWLADQSVGIFPISNSEAAAMLPELNRVLDIGEGGRGSNSLRIQPVERSNSLMVIARSRQKLQQAATWIQRLDNAGVTSSNLRVYKARHVAAPRLAEMVSDVFGADGAAAAQDPSDQFPPESSVVGNGGGEGASPQPSAALVERMGAMGTVADSAPQPSQAGSGRNGGGQFAGVRITSNADNNTVLIYARRDQQAMIEQTIMALDKPSAQVAIEATIAEVVLTNDLRYGVQYYLKGKDGGASLIRDATRTALKQVLPGFNIILGPESDPRVVLDALRGVTEVKVLSSPSVVVVDNRPASLQVGDEVPIVTRTSQSTDNPDAPIVNNVEFRNTGVILNVLPRITGDGTINLEIQQEISSVIGSDTGSLTPTISQRRVSSTVSVMSGQTVLLGGMISEKQTQGREGIPVLGDIPLLGDAFRKTTNAASRTELIVLIRAQVIRDSLDAQHVAEEMRSQLRIMNDGTPRVPLPKPSPSILR